MRMICCGADSGGQVGVLAFMGPADPFLRQKQTETEMKLRYGGEKDPEKPPPPEPGGKYIAIGAIIGLVVGGIAGAVIGGCCFGFLGGVIGALVGIIGGGIAGMQLGKLLKKRRQKANVSGHEPL